MPTCVNLYVSSIDRGSMFLSRTCRSMRRWICCSLVSVRGIEVSPWMMLMIGCVQRGDNR